MKRPTLEDVRVFAHVDEFRDWLHEHHSTETELFIGYYRKGAGKTAMTYVEAVHQALAYGWIDGITYKVSDELTATRFTPRRRGSSWSEVNVARMEALIAAGRAHPAGIAEFEKRTAANTGVYSYENAARDLPDDLAARLRAEPEAWAYWQSRTPTYRRSVTWWVLSAKQEATRQRRMRQLIDDCKAGRPVKPFRYGRVTLEAKGAPG